MIIQTRVRHSEHGGTFLEGNASKLIAALGDGIPEDRTGGAN